jgi:hypothetical protein
MDQELAQLGRVYTADEAAARLRIERRSVITLGKRYGCCSVHGRTAFFSEQDLLDLWQILRATAKEPRPVTVKAVLPGASAVWLREYFRKKQAERDERKRLRREREAAERERRLEEKRTATRAKAALRAAKRIAAVELRAEANSTSAKPQKLDTKNRDPAYWTDERKEQLRHERVERMKNWGPSER